MLSEYSEISKKIIEMAKKDQSVRKDSNKTISEIDLIDSQNRKGIKEIIDQYGLISISKFGEEASNSAWLLIQHFPESEVSYMGKYLNLMLENKSDVLLKNLAYLTDRTAMYKHIPQTYGTQAVRNEKTGEMEIYNTLDPSNIDSRRSEMGLTSIESYIKDFRDAGFEVKIPFSLT